MPRSRRAGEAAAAAEDHADPLVIRLVIAMTPMPDVLCREALARLAGRLADILFALDGMSPTLGESGHGLAGRRCRLRDGSWFGRSPCC